VASKPGAGGAKPGTLPAAKPGAGSIAKPGQLPSTRPGTGGAKPGGGTIAKPGQLPSTRPGTGGAKPGGGTIAKPGQLPSTRPSAGDVGDFLGIQSPGGGRPSTLPAPAPGGGRPSTLPAPRPGGIGDRPGGIGDRPGGIGDRPGIRPGDGNINQGIHNQVGWQNLNRQQINNFHNNWARATTLPAGPRNWAATHPGRVGYWHGWGAGVLGHWGNYHRWGWFNDRWWGIHSPVHGWWWHNYAWYNRPWRYWWTYPTWGTVGAWCGGGAWSEPCYYDYGSGGNVVYENNVVTIGGQQVGTTAEFAQSAADLATVPPPANEEDVKKAEWLSLGTFAVSTNKDDTDPARVVQLAVSKEGIISGTLFNTLTEKSQAVQGKVDKQTQRVAMRVGESEYVVIETGIFNLTQNEAPILIHYGTDRTENGLLVRLEPPPEEGKAAGK
jgi:hypothetical protein